MAIWMVDVSTDDRSRIMIAAIYYWMRVYDL